MLTMHTDTQYKYTYMYAFIAVQRESEHAACMVDIIGQTHYQSQCSEVHVLDNHLNKFLQNTIFK